MDGHTILGKFEISSRSTDQSIRWCTDQTLSRRSFIPTVLNQWHERISFYCILFVSCALVCIKFYLGIRPSWEWSFKKYFISGCLRCIKKLLRFFRLFYCSQDSESSSVSKQELRLYYLTLVPIRWEANIQN